MRNGNDWTAIGSCDEDAARKGMEWMRERDRDLGRTPTFSRRRSGERAARPRGVAIGESGSAKPGRKCPGFLLPGASEPKSAPGACRGKFGSRSLTDDQELCRHRDVKKNAGASDLRP